MPNSSLFQSFRLFDLLLDPVRSILKRLLPDIAEAKLRDPAFREEFLVPKVDRLLVAQMPEAAAVPSGIRKAVIRRILETLVEDILIPEAAASRAAVEADAPELFAAAAEAGIPIPLPPDTGLGVRSITLEAPDAVPLDFDRQVLALLGPDWTFGPFPGLPGYYEVRPSPGHRPTVPEAWEMATALESLPEVTYAEPSITQLPPGSLDDDVDPDGVAARPAGGDPRKTHHLVPETENDPEWSLDLTGAKLLWGDHQGKGIMIGHVDTGYTHHPEVIGNIDTTRGYDSWDKDSDALDDLDPSFWDRIRTNLVVPPQIGHGTSTSSVIASPQGKQQGHESTHGVTGTAPQAKIIPIRATPTVVILPTGSQNEVAAGILAAVERGVHVISMSLGSPWGSRPLEAAVRRALDAGVIVCAAAGNVVLKETWFTDVTYPAAYPGVIAVAGCDYHRRPWRDSCRGPKTVVTAPATDVWNADAEKKGIFRKTIHYSVNRGSGTSYAVATTAGIAACWLRHWIGHHGSRQAFIAHLGGHPRAIPAAFLDCLRRHDAKELVIPSSPPADLPDYPRDFHRNQFGVGIINAESLLGVVPGGSLMAAGGLEMEARAADVESGNSNGVVAELARASGHPPREVYRALAADLGLADGALEGFLHKHGRELLHHFAVDPKLRERLSDLLNPADAIGASARSVSPAPGLAAQLSLSASPTAAANLAR